MIKIVRENNRKQFVNEKRQRIIAGFEEVCKPFLTKIDEDVNMGIVNKDIKMDHWLLINNILALLQMKPINLIEIS